MNPVGGVSAGPNPSIWSSESGFRASKINLYFGRIESTIARQIPEIHLLACVAFLPRRVPRVFP